jgi:hypothetical protein
MAAVSETHLISLIHNKQLYGWKKLPSIPRGTSSKVEFEYLLEQVTLWVYAHISGRATGAAWVQRQ